MEKPKYIEGYKLVNHLVEIGAIPPGNYQRVVMEASVDGPVRIYTQCAGTDKLLSVAMPAPAIVVNVGK